MRVLSIGTGLRDIVALKDKRRFIINALKKMAATSKKVTTRLDSQYKDGGQYYKFNIDKGVTLSDWKNASGISAHTLNYLIENQGIVRKFVDG